MSTVLSAEATFIADHDQMLICCMCKSVLQSPVLLDCLHNSCAKCLDNNAGLSGTGSVTCGVCMDVTNALPSSPNTLIECHLNRSSASVYLSSCGYCAEEGRHGERADVWCHHCKKSLCADCLPGHAKYNKEHATTSLEEVQSSDTVVLAPARQQCRQHAKALDHVCLSCAVPQCVDCGLACARAKHNVQLLGSPESDVFVAKIKDRVCCVMRTLESTTDTLHKRKSLVSDLKAARAAHIQELEKKKRALLDDIDKAVLGAKAAIHDSYDVLDAKASELAVAADQLDEKIGHALKYGHIIVDADDITYLLQQQQVLLARMENVAKERNQAKAPLEASKYVIMNGTEPEAIGKVIKTWIGAPVLVTDDLFCSADHAQLLADRLRSAAQTDTLRSTAQTQTADQCWLQDDENQSNDTGTTPKVLDLGPAISTFRPPVTCRDMAVSSDGCRLLLAAQELGLIEFDLDGVELSSWKPTESTDEGGDEIEEYEDEDDDEEEGDGEEYERGNVQYVYSDLENEEEGDEEEDDEEDSYDEYEVDEYESGEDDEKEEEERKEDERVLAVDVLQDGRVATGLYHSQCVVVLRRDSVAGEAWLEDKRITELGIRPWLLSVHGDLAAVADGSGLLLLSLYWGLVLSRQQRDYSIGSMAVTADAVLTASYKRVRLTDGRVAWVVDACSHDGQLIWRQERGDQVWDVCAAPSEGVLYMALCQSHRVTAVTAGDGSVIKDVLASSSHGLKRPWRLAVGGSGQRAMSAVLSLSGDQKTVTVYQAKRSH